MVQSRLNFFYDFHFINKKQICLYYPLNVDCLIVKKNKISDKNYCNSNYVTKYKKELFLKKKLKIKKIFNHSFINNIVKI